jgi:hypothetical protein
MVCHACPRHCVVSYLMLGLRHYGGRRFQYVRNMRQLYNSKGRQCMFLGAVMCSNMTQIVVTMPANNNCLLVTLYVLFESVKFFGLAVFPSPYSCESGM